MEPEWARKFGRPVAKCEEKLFFKKKIYIRDEIFSS